MRKPSCCSPVAADTVDRAALEDLAAASRILVDQGVFDAAGHVSMRHPERADRFLMSRSLAPELVTGDDIMEFTLECAPCNDSRKPVIERFLHGGIYQKRADVMAVREQASRKMQAEEACAAGDGPEH